jgi:hypothetical protein
MGSNLGKKIFSSVFTLLVFVFILTGCAGIQAANGNPNPGDPGNPTPTPTPTATPQNGSINGVLMWKGDVTRKGLYTETALTPANVNTAQFGKLATFHTDGLLMAQPLFLANLDMGALGTHNVVIFATEHDSVYAFDIDHPSTTSLWERHYVDPTQGITTAPDNFGGRTSLGGEVGITSTPVIDPSTGAMYFVTTLSRNGVVEQWLRVIDVRTGKDFGPGNMQIQASVAGDGKASVNGQIAFNPSIQNQRPGLVLLNGNVLIAWGSFSDFGIYHGWLMAYDAATLQQKAVFNSASQNQPNDPVNGPADHGGGAAFWGGGAAPSVDENGNIYIVGADGSFNLDQGGKNAGDSVLKLQLNGNQFTIVDWFSPSNQACLDAADLEIGSGGVALLPSEVGGGKQLAAVINKEGRLYLLDRNNMGHFNPAGDTQIPQMLIVGNRTCFAGMGGGFAEGPDWQRMYGNASYWNGNLYLATANGTLRQYQFQNGALLGSAPFAQSSNVFGTRGGNTVVSANGTQNAIVWAYEKSGQGGPGILHAYDATSVTREIWNSNMNPADSMGTGIGFAVPVIANGRVITTFDKTAVVFGLH